MTGHDLSISVQKLGYQSLVKLLFDLPDVARVERMSRSDWTVYDVRVDVPERFVEGET
jgi:hypothetical protein